MTTPAVPTPTAIPADSAAGVAACNRWNTTTEVGRFQLVAEFDSTLGAVASWDERLGEPGNRSSWRQYDPAAPATVCYFDGPWAIPVPAALPGTSPQPVPDRDEIIITANGVVAMGPRAGYHTDVPLERP